MNNGFTIISRTEIIEPSILAGSITFAVFLIVAGVLLIFGSHVKVELENGDVAILLILLGLLAADTVADIFAVPTGNYEHSVIAEDSTSVGEIMESFGIEDQEHFVLKITEMESEND